jgi:phosphopantothenoylcysteine decarboxylase / phosphopantothenate---cysteine ligase
VVLVSGPVSLPDPAGASVVRVESAREMEAAVARALETKTDAFVSAAAVADWRVANAAGGKLKKEGNALPELSLAENPDILAGVGHRKAGRPALVIGFAAETSEVVRNATAKLARKGCDLVVANDVGASGETPGGVFGGDRNTIHLVSADGVQHWPTLTKAEAAERLVAELARRLA